MDGNSSYSRGDAFELKTFNVLKVLLENEDFYVNGKRSKIFRKKAYYSQKRRRNIIFDISIETYANNSKEYSLLTLIECKNYSSPVPISDLEEFDSKIGQVGEHNTKGVVITNHSFQSGAYNFAKSSGIALARVHDDDEFEWIVNRQARSMAGLTLNDTIHFLENEVSPSPLNFAAVNDSFALPTLAEMLMQMQVIDSFVYKENFIRIPFITKERITEIIRRIEQYDVYSNKRLDDAKISRFLKQKYAVDFRFETALADGILGRIQFNPLIIEVAKDLRKDIHRWRFTLAHEIGHLILHSKYFTDKISEKTDTESTISFQYIGLEMTSRRLEYQANLFASNLLLPISTLDPLVKKYFKEERIHKDHLYWDNQPVNQQLVLSLLTRMSSTYGVSLEVARIRLIELGLLIDDRFKNLRQVLKSMQLL